LKRQRRPQDNDLEQSVLESAAAKLLRRRGAQSAGILHRKRSLLLSPGGALL
jgi:hypothetical protein